MTLLSESIMNVWCYVLINRDSTGLWKLMVYSMLPKDSVDGITAKFLFENATVTRIFETKVLSLNVIVHTLTYQLSLAKKVQQGQN